MEAGSEARIVFFGTPEFAAYVLRYLVQHGENVVGVVTAPDREKGRGLKLHQSEVADAADELSIPVRKPAKLKDEQLAAQLGELHPDLFVVVAFRILPPSIYTLPRLGSFNVHASLLPKYRGAAPINWAIMRGEKETGITTFLLAEKVDTGSTLLSETLGIGPDETAGEVHDRLMELGAKLALETIRGLVTGSLKPVIQKEELATPAPKIHPPDTVIDFTRPATEVHNFIRGLSPYPGAVTNWPEAGRIKLLRTHLTTNEPLLEPGQMRISDSRLFIGTASVPLEVLELQREGRRAMSAAEFLRGYRLPA